MINILKKVKITVFVLTLIILIFLGIVYLGGVFNYDKKFFPKTFINGMDVGNKSVDDVFELFSNKKNFTIEITGLSGLHEVVNFDGSIFKEQVEINDLKEIKDFQNKYLWFESFYKKTEKTISTIEEYDENSIKNAVTNLNFLKASTPSKNAYITENSGIYSIIDEIQGTEVDYLELESTIVEAVRLKQNKINLEDSNCYVNPTVTKDSIELSDMVKKLNNLKNINITYSFGTENETINYNDIKDWISVDNETFLVNVDEEKASNFIKSLAAKHDTYGKEREFNATDIGTVTVSGGIFGWRIKVDDSTQMLIEYIKTGESVAVEPVYANYGTSKGVDDIGNTYIEVDITRQHMWYYINGELFLDTPVVTGLPYDGRDTPTGVFAAWLKEKERYLKGEDYKLWVDHWIQIDWTGIGIHDSSWQPEYGGELYKIRGKGSHGCINTPYKSVSKIYENLKIGTPVIVYKSPESLLPKNIVNAGDVQVDKNQENLNPTENETSTSGTE